MPPRYHNVQRIKDGAVRSIRTKTKKVLTHCYGYACIFNRTNIAGLTYTSETLFFAEDVPVVGMPLTYMAKVQTSFGERWGQEAVGEIVYVDIDDFGVFMLCQLAPPKALSPIAAQALTLFDTHPFGLTLSSIRSQVEFDKKRRFLTKYPILGVQLYHRTTREVAQDKSDERSE